MHYLRRLGVRAILCATPSGGQTDQAKFMRKSTSKESASVPAAVRTLEIFEAFALAKRPLSLSEIAKLANLPLSSCHSLLRTLEAKGYLYFLEDREAYPTRRMLDLVTEVGQHDPIATRLAPALRALREVTQETVVLGVLQGDSVTYLLTLDGPRMVRLATHTVGYHRPAHLSAIGRAILAQMSPEELNAWIGGRKVLGAAPDRTLPASLLRKEVSRSRDKGYYSHTLEEQDSTSLAAALRFGPLWAGVCVAGPADRVGKSSRKLTQALLQTVGRLERDFVVDSSGRK